MLLKIRYSNIRYKIRRIREYFIRGYYGWAPSDTWAADVYLSGIMAGMFRHLTRRSHGMPHDFTELYKDTDRAETCWNEWLEDKANWLEWYTHNDDVGISEHEGWIDSKLSSEEKKQRVDAYMNKMEKFRTEIMPEIAKFWVNLWD